MNLNTLLTDAANLIRYNPELAIAWFSEARARLDSRKLSILYNKKANEANKYLNSIKTMRYYKEENFFPTLGTFRLIPLVEVDELDINEYLETLAHNGKI